MTLWDAYLFLLHRLGFGPLPSSLAERADEESVELPPIQWFPATEGVRVNPWMWVGVPLACAFALVGQYSLTPLRQSWIGASALVVGAGLLIMESWRLGLDWRARRASVESTAIALQAEAIPLPGLIPQPVAETGIRWRAVALAAITTALTFLFSANNDFNAFARINWIISLVLWIAAFWEGPLARVEWSDSLEHFVRGESRIRISHTLVLFAAVLAVSAWFRFAQLNEAPIAMTSDHVEKLKDVNDILNNGKRPIFEPANGGREPLMFYLAAITAQLAGTGLTPLTLKIVTSVAGFLTLPFIFLLAREISGDTAGLPAMLVAGIGWWPNVISRNGLRFPFAMLFSAIALWLIVRALKREQRNSALLGALALGIGLYGYTPIRVVPVAIGVAFVLYGLHRWSKTVTLKLTVWLLMLLIIVTAAFMPMIRYAVDEPENFWRRTATRITGEPGLETAPPTWQVLLENEWNSVRMFSWTSDSAWLISPADQPALDGVMGALFFLGAAFTLYRYIRYRDWLDLYLLVAVPILLLPSTLALAFPVENPSLHRSGAAIPIVFVIVAIPLCLFVAYGRKVLSQRWGTMVGTAMVALLLVISAQQNWHILFVRYADQYKSSVQNTPELGKVVRAWAESIGDWDTVMVRAYPYWVDTRAVGIYAGKFGWDNVALQLDKLDDLKDDPRPKLFILHRNDAEAIDFLRRVYPNGTLAFHVSEYTEKHFLTYFVPGKLDFDERLLEQP